MSNLTYIKIDDYVSDDETSYMFEEIILDEADDNTSVSSLSFDDKDDSSLTSFSSLQQNKIVEAINSMMTKILESDKRESDLDISDGFDLSSLGSQEDQSEQGKLVQEVMIMMASKQKDSTDKNIPSTINYETPSTSKSKFGEQGEFVKQAMERSKSKQHSLPSTMTFTTKLFNQFNNYQMQMQII